MGRIVTVSQLHCHSHIVKPHCLSSIDHQPAEWVTFRIYHLPMSLGTPLLLTTLIIPFVISYHSPERHFDCRELGRASNLFRIRSGSRIQTKDKVKNDGIIQVLGFYEQSGRYQLK